MSQDDLRLLETAFWLYVMVIAGGVAVFYIVQMIHETRQRRRSERILGRPRR